MVALSRLSTLSSDPVLWGRHCSKAGKAVLCLLRNGPDYQRRVLETNFCLVSTLHEEFLGRVTCYRSASEPWWSRDGVGLLMTGARPSGQSKDDDGFTHVAVARLQRRSVLEHSGQHGHQSVSPRSVLFSRSVFSPVYILLSVMHGTFPHCFVPLSCTDPVSSVSIGPRVSKL